jgi:hypothetical protein
MAKRRVQAFGPVLIGGVDKIRGANHPDSSIDRRVEKLRGKRHMPVEPARLFRQDDVPAVGLDASPDLIDSGPVGDLCADLRLADDLHVHLLERAFPGKVGCQKPLAAMDLSIFPVLVGSATVDRTPNTSSRAGSTCSTTVLCRRGHSPMPGSSSARTRTFLPDQPERLPHQPLRPGEAAHRHGPDQKAASNQFPFAPRAPQTRSH